MAPPDANADASRLEVAEPDDLRALAARQPESPRASELAHELENPAGTRALLARGQDGAALEAYLGRPRTVLVEGERATFTRVTDTWRGEVREAHDRAFGAAFGGAEADRDAVHFGFPDTAAWDAGRPVIKCEVVRTQLLLVAPATSDEAPGGSPEVALEDAADFPAEVDELFERVAPAYGALAVRDRASLRFLYPPAEGFRIVLARVAGRLEGYAVVHREGLPERPELAWLRDWLVHPDAGAVAAALHGRARQEAARAGASGLGAVASEHGSEWISFQRAGYRAESLPRFLVARSFVKQLSMRWLLHNWHYTLGDLIG